MIRTCRVLAVLAALAAAAPSSIPAADGTVGASRPMERQARASRPADGSGTRDLTLPVSASDAPPERLLAGAPDAWSAATSVPVHWNRTPPLYEGDPVDDGHRPPATAAALRSGGALFVRIRWEDATESIPRPPERYAEAGTGSIAVRHSREIAGFADAACVMTPRAPIAGGTWPSLMMGDTAAPVSLYLWNAQRGFETLEAAGRGTTRRTGASFPGRTHRTARGWDAVFEIPDLPAGTPVAFAVWDGGAGQRDGLKLYSLWFEVGS